MDWGNNCWHQALNKIDLHDEFKHLNTPLAVARRIKLEGTLEDGLAGLPYLTRVDVKKARVGDLMVYRNSSRALDVTMAVNVDGLLSMGPNDNFQSYFKTLNATSAYRPCHKE
jgi:hypothetical protein